MKKMTEQNLRAALAGESQAHVKYLAYAEKAEAEKMPNVARAFRANSHAERVHAANYLRTLSEVKSTKDNLAAAVGGETFEVEEMYPAYIEVARFQGEKTAEMYLSAALAAEKVHAGIYKRAMEAVVKGQDLEGRPIHVCGQCGFTMEGEAPDKCPVCGAPRSKFVTF
jgi:rubrerythrin